MNNPPAEPGSPGTSRLEQYVRSRRMENGAYSSILSEGIGVSSIKDTDWALRIFRTLGRLPESPGITRNWLHSVSGEVLEEGDIECSFHLVRSFLELEETLPDLTDFLDRSIERLFPSGQDVFEEEGRLKECRLWLEIGRMSGRPGVAGGHQRIRQYFENGMPSLLAEPIDLPGLGNTLDSFRLLGVRTHLLSRTLWGTFQDPVTGVRLTPESRISTLETAWWGVRLQAVHGHSLRHPEAILDFVDECRTGKGGYGPRPGAVPDLESSGMALEILNSPGLHR
ncbi:MAG: hypothetical protein ACYC9S_01245 [Leptospirales bacterium]